MVPTKPRSCAIRKLIDQDGGNLLRKLKIASADAPAAETIELVSARVSMLARSNRFSILLFLRSRPVTNGLGCQIEGNSGAFRS
jgi:hypothetical protein